MRCHQYENNKYDFTVSNHVYTREDFLWCKENGQPHQADNHNIHTLSNPRANTCPMPAKKINKKLYIVNKLLYTTFLRLTVFGAPKTFILGISNKAIFFDFFGGPVFP